MSGPNEVWYGTYVDTDLRGKPTRWYVECRRCIQLTYDFRAKRPAKQSAEVHAATHPGATVHKGN